MSAGFHSARPEGQPPEDAPLYAQDRLDADALLAMLTPLRLQEPGLRWAVLIDTAFDEGTRPLPVDGEVLNAFADAGALDDLASIAPCLVPLPSGAPGEQVLRRLAEHAGHRPMLSVLASPMDLAALLAHWHPLHLVTTQDGRQTLLLRWADARTLAVLPDILTPEQWGAITAPLAHWCFFNREGQPQACPVAGATPTTAVASSAAWMLTDQQVQQLAHGAEADALYASLVAQRRGLDVPPLRPSVMYRLTRAALARADEAGIDNMADRVSLALAVSLTESQPPMRDRLGALIQSRAWMPGHLLDALLHERVVVLDNNPPRPASGRTGDHP